VEEAEKLAVHAHVLELCNREEAEDPEHKLLGERAEEGGGRSLATAESLSLPDGPVIDCRRDSRGAHTLCALRDAGALARAAHGRRRALLSHGEADVCTELRMRLLNRAN